jgi:hypothetical protein
MQTPADTSLVNDQMREFFLVLRDALLMVVRWIERRYMRR